MLPRVLRKSDKKSITQIRPQGNGRDQESVSQKFGMEKQNGRRPGSEWPPEKVPEGGPKKDGPPGLLQVSSSCARAIRDTLVAYRMKNSRSSVLRASVKVISPSRPRGLVWPGLSVRGREREYTARNWDRIIPDSDREVWKGRERYGKGNHPAGDPGQIPRSQAV